jgi:hypothetical protein
VLAIGVVVGMAIDGGGVMSMVMAMDLCMFVCVCARARVCVCVHVCVARALRVRGEKSIGVVGEIDSFVRTHTHTSFNSSRTAPPSVPSLLLPFLLPM